MKLSDYSMVRVGVCSPELRIADVRFNAARLCDAMREAAHHDCSVLVFPELALTGYTCGDLFYQSTLREEAERGLEELCYCSEIMNMTIFVGMPIVNKGKLFNCCVIISHGDIVAVVPKTYLPNTGEYYEERWFSSAADTEETTIMVCGQEIPFGTDILCVARHDNRLIFGCEICEDVWSVVPPSSLHALAGATILINCSASVELLGKKAYREQLITSQSARCIAAYIYAASGAGESSTDVVFSGHCLIAENGSLLAQSERFSFDTQIAYADIDIEKLTQERIKNNSFAAAQTLHYRIIAIDITERETTKLYRLFTPMPFVPHNLHERAENCHEIMMIQSTGLMKRLKHIGCKTVTIGLSGGLDSTLALLVCVKAFQRLGYDAVNIIAVTMPGFGTTDRTKSNAVALAECLGVTLRTISIHDAVAQHFLDIGHDASVHNIVFENAQARERTQVLMDIAQQTGGIVIGTGDLSELALGWCTYNGDHMSMYGVNSGVPKTLVRYIIEWAAMEEFSGKVSAILHDICDTPVSPELLPPDKEGNIVQKTEETIGPYILHDFFLFYHLRYGFRPKKIAVFAEYVFSDMYDKAIIKQWLNEFYKRFFSQQFKRSCLPDGMKIGSVALSPRGDWRMPSDAAAQLWLDEVAAL